MGPEEKVDDDDEDEALLTYSQENRHKADDRSLPVLHVNIQCFWQKVFWWLMSLWWRRVHKFCSGGAALAPRHAGFMMNYPLPGWMPWIIRAPRLPVFYFSILSVKHNRFSRIIIISIFGFFFSVLHLISVSLFL